MTLNKKLVEDYQKAITNHMKQVAEVMKKSAPNLKPMISYYQTELGKLKDELISDKTIQEVSDFMKKIFGAVSTTLSELFTKISELSQKFSQVVQEHMSKMMELFTKEILPAVREVGGKILDLYVSIMKNIYDIAMVYVTKLSDLLKAHQAEFKQVATVLSEAFQDMGQLLFKSLKNVRDEIQHLLQDLYEQVKALPLFEELKERYKDFLNGTPVPDHVINIMNEVFATIKDALPTPEMKEFVSNIQDYLVKKLKQEKVDDIEVFKKMYSGLVKAINSLIAFIKSHQGDPEDIKGLMDNLLPVPMDTMIRIPRMLAASFSPVNFVTNGDFPTAKQFLHMVSFNPFEWVPPFERHAIIIQGQHIFTFDERHLTFPGTCSYVFAKDVINGNFTIVGTFKDGQLEALTFNDKHDIVTLKKNHQVTLNGQPTELPIRQKELEVFRLYPTVEIVSKAGVRITCEPHLLGCGVRVSGYYHDQLRGLLGNGNHEPYDDFTLPNGKVMIIIEITLVFW